MQREVVYFDFKVLLLSCNKAFNFTKGWRVEVYHGNKEKGAMSQYSYIHKKKSLSARRHTLAGNVFFSTCL